MEARRPRGGHVRAYDFRRPDRFSKEQLRALYMVHENVARAMGTVLSAFYRSLVQVAVRELRQVTYAEFIESVPAPGVVAVLALPPLDGRALLDLDPHLAFPLLDRMFGGPGEPLSQLRPLTDIEQIVIRRVLEALARELAVSWSQLAAVQAAVEAVEVNPRFLQLAAPNEVVLAVELSTQLGPHQGLIRLGLPFMLLEPVLPRLSFGQWFGAKRQQARPETVEEHLRRVEVTVSACLGRARLRLRDLLELEVGDVIQLGRRRGEPVEVLVEGRPKFRADPGRVGERLALRIRGWVDPEGGGGPDVGP